MRTRSLRVGARRARVAATLTVGLLGTAACDFLLTEPAPAPAEVSVAFQLQQAPTGGTAAAFSRIRRARLRFVRPDSAFRDTVVAAIPIGGEVRVALSLEADERIDALGIGAWLGSSAADTLFQGATVARTVPGEITRADVTLLPVPARVRADPQGVSLAGPGATAQLSSAVFYASGDTIETLSGVWTSEDPTIVTVLPTGLATAVRVGTTMLIVRLAGLADTIPAQVTP